MVFKYHNKDIFKELFAWLGFSVSLLLVTYIAVHRCRGVRNSRRHGERITSPENITKQKLTNMASGILVGTNFCGSHKTLQN